MVIVIENFDDADKIWLAEAMIANGLVRKIERESYRDSYIQNNSSLYSRSREEVAEAVVDVVGRFGVSTQWVAVYRVLVDYCGWNDYIPAFVRIMNILMRDVNVSCKCSYQSIQKPLSQNSILRKDFREWKKYDVPKGDRVFPRQMKIAQMLLERLSIFV